LGDKKSLTYFTTPNIVNEGGKIMIDKLNLTKYNFNVWKESDGLVNEEAVSYFERNKDKYFIFLKARVNLSKPFTKADRLVTQRIKEISEGEVKFDLSTISLKVKFYTIGGKVKTNILELPSPYIQVPEIQIESHKNGELVHCKQSGFNLKNAVEYIVLVTDNPNCISELN